MNKPTRTVIVHLVAGARPNFMKIAPLYFALRNESWCQPVLVHTGQHFDENMSEAIWRELGLPPADHALGVGQGSHAEQTASVMVVYEKLCLSQIPDWVVVVGDVNSTLACALVAKKLGVPVAHLEAGLRSGDRSMPEEINRICVDAIADLLWTPSRDADDNLRREGVDVSRIVRVGNIMLDSLELMRPRIDEVKKAATLGLSPSSFGVVTLHRPNNVDDKSSLQMVVKVLAEASNHLPLVFPVHPRTWANLVRFGLDQELASAPHIHCVEPLGYCEFMSLVFDARLVITDSGGIQEETTYLGTPCLTLRDTTERPVTVTEGTNKLVQLQGLIGEIENILSHGQLCYSVPNLWDGQTAGRVVESLRRAV